MQIPLLTIDASFSIETALMRGGRQLVLDGLPQSSINTVMKRHIFHPGFYHYQGMGPCGIASLLYINACLCYDQDQMEKQTEKADGIGSSRKEQVIEDLFCFG